MVKAMAMAVVMMILMVLVGKRDRAGYGVGDCHDDECGNDIANDDDIYEILRYHIITSDGGFLFSNGSSIYKTNSQGQIEWINNNLEITQTLDIVEQNRNFVLVGTYSIYGYIDYDYGCGYIDCAAIAILIDEYAYLNHYRLSLA